MVDITVLPARAVRHVDDGDIVLVRGGVTIGTVLLANISGPKWNRQKLQRLADAAQEQIDHRRLIADLEDIDPNKVAALAGDDAWFATRYGGRSLIDGVNIASRSDTISFTYQEIENEDGTLGPLDLLPRVEATV